MGACSWLHPGKKERQECLKRVRRGYLVTVPCGTAATAVGLALAVYGEF
jgi:hypothetical protein